MDSEQIYNRIDNAIRALPWNGRPTPFQNGVSRVLHEGEFIARVNGFDWVDGEGYPTGYYDAVLKGVRHNLQIDSYPQDVHDFYSKFL